MRRSQKLIATLWTTLLVAPVIFLCAAYALMSCSEIDPCPTGGLMPFAPLAVLLLLAVLSAQTAFLAMIWRGTPDIED